VSTTTQALHGRGLLAVLVTLVLAAFSTVAGLAVVAQVLVGPMGLSSGQAGQAVADIPADYLVLYRAAASRYELAADGWSVLAAVGKVECDHGRGPDVGCGRGERNSAGAAGPAQFLAGTWARYGVDGDGDGDRDVWDPVDAIFGMAHYLRASGAPRDWRAALFAYNHAGWYVDKVLAQAAEYRRDAATTPTGIRTSVAPLGDGAWLAPVPGFPGERCEARIIRDVVALVAAFRLHVSDCFGGAPPHELHGEHPLGLALDAEPADGDWDHTMAMARAFGWDESCAPSGCPGRGPFRVVLYNGYPSHGDPSHSDIPHIHVSWQHAPAEPFTPAAWVRTLTSVSSSTTSPPGRGGRR
jgi:hypothetical protein